MKLFLRLHARQLLIISVIATSGLLAGSIASVKSARETKPLPTREPTIVSRSPLPVARVVPLASPLSTPSPTAKRKTQKISLPPAPQSPRKNFIWGITIQPFPFQEDNDKFLPEQLRLANELGVKAIRLDYSPNNETMNRLAFEQAKKYHLTLVFIIPFGPNDIFTDRDLYNNSYHYVADIVSKYKGEISVWQLANEVAAVALIDGAHHGVDRIDYPEDKYQAVATWLKAASTAVHDTDPSAKRLVTDHWVHVGFFDRFFAEGGQFDILGWNWFSDMGNDMNRVVLNARTGQIYHLLTKLKSFKKELWLSEISRRLGSQGGKEKEQADFIQKMAEYAYANPAISGFFVFKLSEDETARVEESGYSLINLDHDKKWVAGLKEAFGRYQALIRVKKE